MTQVFGTSAIIYSISFIASSQLNLKRIYLSSENK